MGLLASKTAEHIHSQLPEDVLALRLVCASADLPYGRFPRSAGIFHTQRSWPEPLNVQFWTDCVVTPISQSNATDRAPAQGYDLGAVRSSWRSEIVFRLRHKPVHLPLEQDASMF